LAVRRHPCEHIQVAVAGEAAPFWLVLVGTTWVRVTRR
jgi:hypothetical protein